VSKTPLNKGFSNLKNKQPRIIKISVKTKIENLIAATLLITKSKQKTKLKLLSK
jgi:hypothetical protein